MSLATKIAAGLCICPVVAAPPALMHKPTRDKIARAAGYVPKAQKPAAPVAIQPQIACVEPSPSSPLVALNELSNATPVDMPQTNQGVPQIAGIPRRDPGPFPFVPRDRPDIPDEPGPPDGPPITEPPPPPPPTTAVPEPATWTAMVVGFGLVGAAVRRTGSRTRVTTTFQKDETHA